MGVLGDLWNFLILLGRWAVTGFLRIPALTGRGYGGSGTCPTRIKKRPGEIFRLSRAGVEEKQTLVRLFVAGVAIAATRMTAATATAWMGSAKSAMHVRA